MRRRCLLVCVLFLGLGCASEDTKAQWNEFLKDLRGDNMEMRYDNLGSGNPPAPRKTAD
jgi:hypothetical protein